MLAAVHTKATLAVSHGRMSARGAGLMASRGRVICRNLVNCLITAYGSLLYVCHNVPPKPYSN